MDDVLLAVLRDLVRWDGFRGCGAVIGKNSRKALAVAIQRLNVQLLSAGGDRKQAAALGADIPAAGLLDGCLVDIGDYMTSRDIPPTLSVISA